MFEAVTWELGERDLITNTDLDGCTGTTALQHGGRNWLLLFTHALILILSSASRLELLFSSQQLLFGVL